MKKIVRLTESDITRIVKRVMSEDMDDPIKCAQKYIDFAFTTKKNDGDLPYWNDNVIPGINDKAAYKRFIKYLKDVMDTPLYDDEECEGVTFDDVAPFIRELYIKKINDYYLGENKKPKKTTHPGDKNFRNGVVKRVIDTLEKAAYYTMGTKVSADLIMRLIERGGNVFMYTDRSGDKIFIDTLSKGVYDQLDRRIGEVTGNMDDWAMDYFENSMNESLSEALGLLGDPKSHGSSSEWDTPHSEKRIDRELSDKEFYEKYKNKGLGWDVPHNQKRNRMSSIKSKGKLKEALGLLGDEPSKGGRKMPKQYPTRHIKSMEDAIRYTKGTKMDAKFLYDAYMNRGEAIEVIMNPENVTGPNGRHRKIFVFNKSGDVFNELGRKIGNYQEEGYEKFEDYLES